MKTKKTPYKIVVSLLMVVLLSVSASAMGIGRTYLEDDTLKLDKCEIEQIELELQNVEDKEVFVELEITSTGCVSAHIVGEEEYYQLLPNHEGDKFVNVEIIAGENCNAGDLSHIDYSMKVAKSQFGLAFTQGFDVIITDEVRDCEVVKKKIEEIKSENEERNTSLTYDNTDLPKSTADNSLMNIKLKEPTSLWAYILSGFLLMGLVVYIYNDRKKSKNQEEKKENKEYESN